MDRLKRMAVFVKAVDLDSFAAAATTLDLSGPMARKHIRFLKSVWAYASSTGPRAMGPTLPSRLEGRSGSGAAA